MQCISICQMVTQGLSKMRIDMLTIGDKRCKTKRRSTRLKLNASSRYKGDSWELCKAMLVASTKKKQINLIESNTTNHSLLRGRLVGDAMRFPEVTSTKKFLCLLSGRSSSLLLTLWLKSALICCRSLAMHPWAGPSGAWNRSDSKTCATTPSSTDISVSST